MGKSPEKVNAKIKGKPATWPASNVVSDAELEKQIANGSEHAKQLKAARKAAANEGAALPFARALALVAPALEGRGAVAYACDLGGKAAGYYRYSDKPSRRTPSLTVSAEATGKVLAVLFSWETTTGGDYGADVMHPAGSILIDSVRIVKRASGETNREVPCFILTVWKRAASCGSQRGHYWSVSERIGGAFGQVVPAGHPKASDGRGGRSQYLSGYAPTIAEACHAAEVVVLRVLRAMEKAGVYAEAAAARLAVVKAGSDNVDTCQAGAAGSAPASVGCLPLLEGRKLHADNAKPAGPDYRRAGQGDAPTASERAASRAWLESD